MKLKIYSDGHIDDLGWVWFKDNKGDWALCDYTEYGMSVMDLLQLRGGQLISPATTLSAVIRHALLQGINEVELNGMCALQYSYRSLHCTLKLRDFILLTPDLKSVTI